MSELDPNDVYQQINERTNDQHSQLAQDIDRSIEVLFSEIDLGGGPAPGGIEPGMALSIMRPMIRQKADQEPATIRKTLAIIHLESGALLEQHTDEETDPTDLI